MGALRIGEDVCTESCKLDGEVVGGDMEEAFSPQEEGLVENTGVYGGD